MQYHTNLYYNFKGKGSSLGSCVPILNRNLPVLDFKGLKAVPHISKDCKLQSPYSIFLTKYSVEVCCVSPLILKTVEAKKGNHQISLLLNSNG